MATQHACVYAPHALCDVRHTVRARARALIVTLYTQALCAASDTERNTFGYLAGLFTYSLHTCPEVDRRPLFLVTGHDSLLSLSLGFAGGSFVLFSKYHGRPDLGVRTSGTTAPNAL